MERLHPRFSGKSIGRWYWRYLGIDSLPLLYFLSVHQAAKKKANRLGLAFSQNAGVYWIGAEEGT
jgi:hypothetical protein